MQKISSGIEPLKTAIRIWWKIDGERHRETIHNSPPTDANLAAAANDKLIYCLKLSTPYNHKSTKSKTIPKIQSL